MSNLNQLNCKIDSDIKVLDALNKTFKWIPSSENIRPIQELIEKKESDYTFFDNFYSSVTDQILIRYFKFPSRINRKSNKMEIKISLENIRDKIFLENEYPYNLPDGTNHYVMWYTYNDISDIEITSDILDSLKNILKHNNFEFVWYENPKMSVPEVYHVQVFWHLI